MKYSFCEGVLATSRSKWHIRELTGAGRRLSGGVDTQSLCGRVGSPNLNGWDLKVEITEHHLEHNTCPECLRVWQELKPAVWCRAQR